MKNVRLLILGAFLAHGLALGELFSLLEGLGLPDAGRAVLGWGRAAATAAVLSFSSASLAKHLANHRVEGSTREILPVFLWVAESVLLVILIAPLLVFQLRHSPLITVIAEPWAQWLVCIAAVLAIEISVAGGMYCKGQASAESVETVKPVSDDETLVQQALQEARMKRERPRQPSEAPEVSHQRPAKTSTQRPPGEAYPRVLELLRQGLSGRQTARETGLSPATVSRYRRRAVLAGELAS